VSRIADGSSIRQRSELGFSLAEALIATVLGLVICGTAVALAGPDVRLAHVQPAMIDMQQRARVALDALVRDLRNAGTGLESDDEFAGGLGAHFAAVIPRGIGRTVNDPFNVVRDDTVSILSIDRERRHARLGEPLGPDGRLVTLPSPHCPPGEPLCGLREGTSLVVFDGTGRFDLFVLAAVDLSAGRVEALRSPPPEPYPIGSAVAEVTLRTYYFDSPARQLRQTDGRSTDVPVVDDVVNVSFRFAGESRPPVRPKPPAGVANCLFDELGRPVPGLEQLSQSDPAQVALPSALLADGPWCGSGEYRYDADLLRVRQIHAVITVQATPDIFRFAGPGFRQPGSGRDALRRLPDFSLRLSVAPRLAGGGR